MKRLLFLVPLFASLSILSADEIIPAVYHPQGSGTSVEMSDIQYRRRVRRRRRRVRRYIRRHTELVPQGGNVSA